MSEQSKSAFKRAKSFFIEFFFLFFFLCVNGLIRGRSEKLQRPVRVLIFQ